MVTMVTIVGDGLSIGNPTLQEHVWGQGLGLEGSFVFPIEVPPIDPGSCYCSMLIILTEIHQPSLGEGGPNTALHHPIHVHMHCSMDYIEGTRHGTITVLFAPS